MTELLPGVRTEDQAKFEADMTEYTRELIALCWNNAEFVRELTRVLFMIGNIPFNYQYRHPEARP